MVGNGGEKRGREGGVLTSVGVMGREVALMVGDGE